MSNPKDPVVGDIVHFYCLVQSEGREPVESEPQAAIVTAVHSPSCVNLKIFDDDGGASHRTSVVYEANDLAEGVEADPELAPGAVYKNGPFCWLPRA